MKNKGFSLVELIIVIAIMAILVGVMAPFLYNYIEKTNVSADVQLCDTIQDAIVTAMVDPDVMNADDDSATQIAYLQDGNVYSISYCTGESEFTRNVCEIVGKDIVGHGSDDIQNTRDLMKSKTARNSGELMVQMDNGQVYVWIDHSDNSGKNGDYSCTGCSALETSNVIYAY